MNRSLLEILIDPVSDERLTLEASQFDGDEILEGTLRAGGRQYPITDGIHQKTMRRIVALSLSSAVNQVKEYLPKDLLNRTGLMGRADSIKRYHYPRNKKELSDARRRLAFDELFLIALVAEKRRLDWKSEIASPDISLSLIHI